jgi:outer membrane receptor protein involved in Fe transport
VVQGVAAFVLGVTLFGVTAGARAGELHESAADPSAFSTVIDARQYDERFATVEELLSEVPGAQVRRFGGLGARSTVGIRGAKAEQVVVMLDGVRLNSSSRGSADLSTIPLRQVAKIEVIRGGGAARYGTDAAGGVVLITTRNAENAGLGVDASATLGQLETRGLDAGVSFGGERASGLLSLTRMASENDFRFQMEPPLNTPGVETQSFRRLNSDFVENGALLRGTLNTSLHTRLDATLDLYQKDNGQPGSVIGRPLAGATDETMSCLTPDESYDRGVARLAFDHDRLFGGAFELAGAVRSDDGELRDPGGACGLVRPIVTLQDHSSWRETESLVEASWGSPRWDWGWVTVSTQTSADLRYTTVDSSDADLHRRTLVLGSLRPELAFFDRALRVFPALGVEGADTSAGLARAGQSQPLVPVAVKDETAWMPGVGAIWQVSPGLRLKSNWKRVVRRPSFTELFHPDWGYVRGNPNLASERGWNADVGFELASEGVADARDLRLEASLFQRDYDQTIEWLLATNNAFMPLNVGPARVQGLEVALGARLFQKLELSASYTRSNGRFADQAVEAAFVVDGKRLFPHLPVDAVTANAALELDVVRPFVQLRYESESALAVGRLTMAPAATQVDAGVIFRPGRISWLSFLSPNVSLSVEGSNLSGVQRVDSLGEPLPKQALWIVRVRGATQ